MPAHADPQELEAYARRSLPTADLVRVDAHLAACAECRRRAGHLAHIDESLAALQQELVGPGHVLAAHPLYDQLAAYVDGDLAARDRSVEEHVAACGQCAERVERLRLLRGQMAVPNGVAHAAVRPSVLARLVDWLAALSHHGVHLRRWAPRLIAGAAVAALLLVAGVSGVRTHRLQVDLATARLLQSQQEVRLRAAAAQQAALRSERDRFAREGRQAERRYREAERQRAELANALAVRDPERPGAARPSGLLRTSPPALLAALPHREDLMGSGGAMRSFALGFPMDEAVVEDRPVFRWQRAAGASAYRVSVSEGSDISHEVFRHETSGTHWSPARPLARGRTYSWQVIPLRGRSEVPGVICAPVRAWFVVLPNSSLGELSEAARGPIRARRDLAVRYSNAGVYSRAEAILRSMLHENPSDTETRALLKRIQALRSAHP